MTDTDQLGTILGDLIEVLHRQAKELEKLVAHVEQVTTRLPEANRLALIASELSELHLRIQKLRDTRRTPEKTEAS
ncbi:MAG TPA: hypothetical protein VEL76_31425 [Gemmataceae bacterium]|nr:hypothetical protein [Gemmataceae bacterium]